VPAAPVSVSDVAEWLHTLGLERYHQVFEDNDIDGEVLADLDDADLEKLGVSLGHRKKLLKAISTLGADGSDASHDEAPKAPEPPGERRQVTVLFADLVGFTRLTQELGAEAMHLITDRFFALADEVIAGFGGTIDKHIGDCVMAVFGAPVAHHNDPERAVRAAFAICDAMPELSRKFGRDLGTHIGIASGQVVASGGGGHKRYSITGASVNLASRLTDQAPPGTIMVSEEVRRVLADRLECVEVEPLTLKGIAAPVRALRAIALREATPRERPFVGREAERRQLDGVLRACLDHGRGQAVHIRGEAGIGKTRLLEELQRQAAGAGFACHKGLVLDFGASAGQDAIGSLLRSLLGLSAADDAATNVAAIDAALGQGLTSDRRVFLHDLLGLPQPDDLRALYAALDNRTRIRGQQDTLAELAERASLRTPQLLIVEDVQWADLATQGHLARLVRAVSAMRAVLIMTTRLEGDPLDDAWRSSAGGNPLLTLDLGPLADDEANRLAAAYTDANTDVARRCIARAGGNPLFLDQLLRHAGESAEEGVPGSVQSLVQARLDHLAPGDRQALQAASVLGQRFTADALSHLLGEPTHDCTNLVRHLLVRAIGDEYLFAHALIRDGVYDSLLTARRSALHLRAADWFATRDPILHAEHLDRAQDPAAPNAYLEAARCQMAIYRYDAANALTIRGLAIAGTGEQSFELTCLRGEILHDLGVMAEAGAAYAAALDAASDDAQHCRAWLGLAAVKRVTDDLDGAFADLQRAEAAAQALGLSNQLARIHFLRGNLQFPLGHIDACLKEHSMSLACAQEIGAPDLEAAALGGLGDAEYARGHMLSAHRYFGRCIEICRVHGFGRIEVPNLPMAAVTRFYGGELAEAFAEATAAVRAAEQVGHHRATMISCQIVYFTATARGETEVARDHVERGLDLSRQLRARRFEAELLWFDAERRRADGCRVEALAQIREALAISRETGISYIGPAILGALARTTDDEAERRAALAEAEELLAAGSISHNYFWFYQDAIETSLAQHAWADLERYVQALSDYTHAEPLPYTDAFIERGRALAAFGRNPRDPDVVQALEHARRRARRIGWISGLPALEAALVTLKGSSAC